MQVGQIDSDNSLLTYGEHFMQKMDYGIRERGKIITGIDNGDLRLVANLVKILTWRYTETGEVVAIEGAVMCAERATEMTPSDSPDRANWLNNLGNLLAWRYERTGYLNDLQQAIFRIEEALWLTPCNHPYLAGRLFNLANCLGRRFERTSAMDDLEAAILNSRVAVDLTPSGHHNKASRLSSLGNWLSRRHERTGSTGDLSEAIKLAYEAIDIMPKGHPNRPNSFVSLGNMLALRYRQTSDHKDLEQAANLIIYAIRSTPIKFPNRMNWLNNLVKILAWTYERTHSPADLRNAIISARKVLETIPDDHPSRASSLLNLGNLLDYEYDQIEGVEIDKERLLCYEGCWNCENASPAVRIRAAQKAADILLRLGELEESGIRLGRAVHLLPSISLCNLKQRDQQHILKEFAGLATLAASILLTSKNGATRALQLLEIGRGVISWPQISGRIDTEIQGEQQMEMVEGCNLSHMSNGSLDACLPLCNCGITIRPPGASQACELREMETPFEMPQSSSAGNYLIPTKNELKAASLGGPIVVINVSPLRCDALLLRPDAIELVCLPNLHHEDIIRNVDLFKSICGSPERSFRAKDNMLSILEWLWDAVASPVLEGLGFNESPADDEWPHVCWIPTGLLSLLPLHAAGYHHVGSLETVIDRVVSSYSPSVKALLYAQKKGASLFHTQRNVLLVSMGITPNCSALGKAEEEIAAVEEFAPPNALVTRLERPRKEDVINSLKICDLFHFAGHSMLDSVDPSKSRLLLQDWQSNPLMVEHITALKRHDNDPFLAYLSACSTGASSAERLHDESINLMTACQLAGFRHTVGSLWDVDDIYSVDTAREFYKGLGDSGEIDDRAVAWGVHSAARHLRRITRRRSDTGDPFAWAAYIHIGPYG